MALYDNYLGAEQRLRFDGSNAMPTIQQPRDFAQTQSGQASELSPNFLGGQVDPVTGNLIAGTKDKVRKGSAVTPYPTTPGTQTPTAPTAPTIAGGGGFFSETGTSPLKGGGTPPAPRAPTQVEGGGGFFSETGASPLSGSAPRHSTPIPAPGTPSSLLATV